MENKLVLRNDLDLMTLGDVMVKSGFFQDSRDAAQAIVKIMAGRELGFGPVASMTGINIIKGRVTISSNLIAAAIKRTGKYNYRVRRQDNDGCEIEFFEGSQSIGVSSFTKNDAQAAGLVSGDNWRKYPRNMFFARAISNGAKWFCPDVFGGPVYTPDEMGAEIDAETGEVLQYPAEPIQPDLQPATPALQPATPEKPNAARTPVSSDRPTKTNGNGINSPQALLKAVNNRVLATYNELPHLLNAIKQELGDDWKWPKPGDTDGWHQALDAAIKHARAQEQPDADQPDMFAGSPLSQQGGGAAYSEG